MPGQFLTKSERERLNKFPEDISKNDIITFFTLTDSDLNQIPTKSADYNRLGFALQLCTLRFLGFCPDELKIAPSKVIVYVANQLGVEPQILEYYAQREQTRTDHLKVIRKYLGFKKASEEDFAKLSRWLLERALEHDKPSLLFQMAVDWLYSEKIVRPGITTIERMVITARQEAQEETYRRLNFLINDKRKAFLDDLLVPHEGQTLLSWLRRGAISNTPENILKNVEKLNFLYKAGVDKWNLSILNPNRQKFLAKIGRRATNQALQRMNPQRRYPILISFLRQSLENIIDELIEIFDRCLANCNNRAKRELKEFRQEIAKTTNEKLILLKKIGQILLDTNIPDSQLRDAIYQRIPEEKLRGSISECEELIRPKDDNAYDYLAKRYSYIRRFAPSFLQTLNFNSHRKNDPLIEALSIIKELNLTGKRNVPEDAPLEFISQSWLPHVLEKDKINRHYYEISFLFGLRGALRSGDIWVENSRRYADPESYLIPKS